MIIAIIKKISPSDSDWYSLRHSSAINRSTMSTVLFNIDVHLKGHSSNCSPNTVSWPHWFFWFRLALNSKCQDQWGERWYSDTTRRPLINCSMALPLRADAQLNYPLLTHENLNGCFFYWFSGCAESSYRCPNLRKLSGATRRCLCITANSAAESFKNKTIY